MDNVIEISNVVRFLTKQNIHHDMQNEIMKYYQSIKLSKPKPPVKLYKPNDLLTVITGPAPRSKNAFINVVWSYINYNNLLDNFNDTSIIYAYKNQNLFSLCSNKQIINSDNLSNIIKKNITKIE